MITYRLKLAGELSIQWFRVESNDQDTIDLVCNHKGLVVHLGLICWIWQLRHCMGKRELSISEANIVTNFMARRTFDMKIINHWIIESQITAFEMALV